MRLRFADPLEIEFQRDYGEKSLPAVRAGLLLGVAVTIKLPRVDPPGIA